MSRQIWATFAEKRTDCFNSYRAEVVGRAGLGYGEEFRMRALSMFGRGTKLQNPARWLTVRVIEYVPHAVGNTGGYRLALLQDSLPSDAQKARRDEKERQGRLALNG